MFIIRAIITIRFLKTRVAHCQFNHIIIHRNQDVSTRSLNNIDSLTIFSDPRLLRWYHMGVLLGCHSSFLKGCERSTFQTAISFYKRVHVVIAYQSVQVSAFSLQYYIDVFSFSILRFILDTTLNNLPSWEIKRDIRLVDIFINVYSYR